MNARGDRDVPTDINIAEALAFNKQVVNRTNGFEIIASQNSKIQREIDDIYGIDVIIRLLDTIGGPNYIKETLDLELAQMIIDVLNEFEYEGRYTNKYKRWQEEELNLDLILMLTNNLIGIINDNANFFTRRVLQSNGSTNEFNASFERLRGLLASVIDLNNKALDEHCKD